MDAVGPRRKGRKSLRLGRGPAFGFNPAGSCIHPLPQEALGRKGTRLSLLLDPGDLSEGHTMSDEEALRLRTRACFAEPL